MLRRFDCEAAPSDVSICVGIWITWCTVTPGISISEKPTAEADNGGALLSVVPSRVTRSVWNVRVGKVSVWPDVSVRRRRQVVADRVLAVEGQRHRRDPPGRSPRCGCTTVMWFVVTGVVSWACHHCPAGSGTNVPVIQAVSKLLSMALYAWSSGVYETLLP